jgi:dTDP-4-amino-4,6-dideoxygalactose transaminase
MNSPYEAVDAFEKKVAEYAGAKYGVAVNSCSNALFLSAVYRRNERFPICELSKGGELYKGREVLPAIIIPRYTYIGVPYAIINAGYKVRFDPAEEWEGAYWLSPLDIIDSARRFRKNMYIPNTLYCLSFHETKILPIGDGGMILTDDKKAYDTLRKMRFDGRTPGKSVFDDTFDTPGYHMHMKPDVAIRGLMLMAGVKDYNDDLPEVYPDLSKIDYFRGK